MIKISLLGTLILVQCHLTQFTAVCFCVWDLQLPFRTSEIALRNLKNKKNSNSIDISKLIASENLSDDHKMLLASPQPVRRQLHTSQDAVVVVTTQDKMARIKSLGNSQETE